MWDLATSLPSIPTVLMVAQVEDPLWHGRTLWIRSWTQAGLWHIFSLRRSYLDVS